jgi:hypothetical protein
MGAGWIHEEDEQAYTKNGFTPFAAGVRSKHLQMRAI